MRALLILLVASLLLQLVSPWWWTFVPLIVLLAYLLRSRNWLARPFLTGFVAIFLLWGGAALWQDLGNEGLLSYRMAGLFSLPSGWMLVLITGLIGGLLGGLAAWTGSAMNRVAGSR